MKYIRTKYAICELNDDWELFCKDKLADTIEELCDEFVCIKQDKTKAIHTNDINNFIYWKMNFKYKDECDFYGAIWTDKGLIFVAKMNDKGDLKLL